MHPNIELIYSPDCPHAEEARTALRAALKKEGLSVKWAEWNRLAENAPAHARRYGSPTILVNGRDVSEAGGSALPHAGGDAGGADCCRVYQSPGGFRGAPSPEMITRSLSAGAR